LLCHLGQDEASGVQLSLSLGSLLLLLLMHMWSLCLVWLVPRLPGRVCLWVLALWLAGIELRLHVLRSLQLLILQLWTAR